MKLTDDIAHAVIKWVNDCERSNLSGEEKYRRLHMAIEEHTKPIEKELIDMIEALSYACNDEDISLEGASEEAVGQVEGTYKDLLKYATGQDIPWKAALKARGALADNLELSEKSAAGLDG